VNELKKKLADALKSQTKSNDDLTKYWIVQKKAIINNGAAYTVDKKAKVVSNEVYVLTRGAYKDPKTKNIYRVVKNALVNKKGNIYTKSREFSYVKESGKFKKVYAYVKDKNAFKNKNGNIYKLAKKALVSADGEIYLPNSSSFIGMGGVVYTKNNDAHIEDGKVYLKKVTGHESMDKD
jgi:hypothetical protein